MSMSDPTSTDVKSDSEPWTILENLILVQAIYKCGDTNWVAIARTIKGHPQVHRTSNFFSQKSCAIQYTQLIENHEAETRRTKGARGNETGAPSGQDVPSIVRLAGQLYNQRILELKALIKKDEERFRSLVAELDEIRQGKWDNQLEEELRKSPPQTVGHVGDEETKADSTDSTVAIVAETSVTGESIAAPIATDQQQPSVQPESESVPSSESSIAPSTLDSTSTLTPADKPELISARVVEGSVAELVPPAQVKTEAAEPSAVLSADKDVEMEDVSGTELSTAQLQALPSSDSINSQDRHTDVEMEDNSKEISPAVPENGTPDASTDSTLDHGVLANSEVTEAPAVEDNIEPSSKESQTSRPETQDTDKSTAGDIAGTPSEENTEAPRDEGADEMKLEDERTLEPTEPTLPHEPDAQSGDGTSQDLKEGVELKTEDTDMEVGTEGDTTQEQAEEGVTSADDDENASTKSGRKPRKIKTAVPAKRKRRHGRSGGGDHEDGYQSSDSETTDSANTNVSDQLARTQMDDKKWKKILMMIWSDIANHRFGAVFMQPIKEQDAPGYYYMIKRPMDLKSIKERIRDGQITNADEFHRDVLLMFMNAIMYNNEDTEIHQMALAMMTEVEFIIKNFKSSQSFAPPSIAASNAGGSGAAYE